MLEENDKKRIKTINKEKYFIVLLKNIRSSKTSSPKWRIKFYRTLCEIIKFTLIFKLTLIFTNSIYSNVYWFFDLELLNPCISIILQMSKFWVRNNQSILNISELLMKSLGSFILQNRERDNIKTLQNQVESVGSNLRFPNNHI